MSNSSGARNWAIFREEDGKRVRVSEEVLTEAAAKARATKLTESSAQTGLKFVAKQLLAG